ncbi:MAG: hypothetical protein ABI553_04370 [Chloroflexota bacterium]
MVVEFGAAPRQDVIDRFVAGAKVSDSELTEVWTTTTQTSGVWNAPGYRRVFETIRSLNANNSHKVRVILGDPGRAAALCGRTDLESGQPCIDRDAFMAAAALAELGAGHRVLILAGVFHVWRPPDSREASAMSRIVAPGHEPYVLLPFGPLANNKAVRDHIAQLPGTSIVTDPWLDTVPSSALRGTTTVDCDNPPCETPDTSGSLKDVADGFVNLEP